MAVYEWTRKTLRFRFDAGTSRGVYRTHDVWYILVRDAKGRVTGVGEAAPLAGLSREFESPAQYEAMIDDILTPANRGHALRMADLADKPSLLFGLETALRSSYRGSMKLFENAFTRGEAPVPINGLIWMGDFETMRARIEEKLAAGFRCLKLKIGAIDFEKELALLAMIRGMCPREKLTLRVDANGAFSPDEAMEKLEALDRFDLHSIEQPIAAGQFEAMRRLTESSPVPIALDEELIGVNDLPGKVRLLEAVRPHYLVLKPTLHGAMRGAKEWMRLAQKRGIGCWMTSALESNIGLNAIAQFCAETNPHMAQGLGTGQIYENNVALECLSLRGDEMHFDPAGAMVAVEEISRRIEAL